MKAFIGWLLLVLHSVAFAATGWKGTTETCHATQIAACQEAIETQAPQYLASGYGPQMRGTVCWAVHPSDPQGGLEITGLSECTIEEGCEGKSGQRPFGQPESPFRSHVSPMATYCDGTCEYSLMLEQDMDLMSHTGGAYGSEVFWSHMGMFKYNGVSCQTQGDPSSTSQGAIGQNCPAGEVQVQPGGGQFGCIAQIQVSGVGDGSGGPSGPTGQQNPSDGLTREAPNNFDPSKCTGGAVGARDPLGGGTLCLTINSWSEVHNVNSQAVTVVGADDPNAVKRNFETDPVGGGGGGGGDGSKGCGLPDTPACKMDETGTPTPADVAGAAEAATASVNSAGDGHVAAINGAGPGGGGHRTELGLSWIPMAPVGSCSEFSITFRGNTYTTDWCGLLAYIRAFLQWGALFLAALYIWRRTTDTISGTASA